MRRGNGEIDDDLDSGIAQEIVDAPRRHAVLLRARFGCFRVEVGDAPDVEDWKRLRRLEIRLADVAASDDADADPLHD